MTDLVSLACTRRVWLHPCTNDHPNAINNHLKPGFRAFKTEEKAG